MAKTSMKIKQQMAPKFSTRAYNRCKICGRPHAYLRKYGICRICFRELAYKGEIPGVKKGQLVSRPAAGTNRFYNEFRRLVACNITDPIADLLTRIRNASTAKHPSVDIPASNLKKAIANILLEEGYVKGVQVIDDDKQGVIRIALKYSRDRRSRYHGHPPRFQARPAYLHQL